MTREAEWNMDAGTDAGQAARAYWLIQLEKMAKPVLVSLKDRRLKLDMPVEAVEGANRAEYTHLEALGRLLAGIAPWLESSPAQEEERLRAVYAELAREALDAATDPGSPDFMNFSEGGQPIVDAAFLAQALLRAPGELWIGLEPRVRNNVVAALQATRTRKPHASNWLLFSAIIEAALYVAGDRTWDPMRIDYALRQHEQWYAGDGAYCDGPEFHWDYYNSFVIHPMLKDILETVGHLDAEWEAMKELVTPRWRRYAGVLERLIAPDGTFPPIGRSLAYRGGAFHSLAQCALKDALPDELEPAQVRSALTAVIRRTMEPEGTYTEDGWLAIGLGGSQPGLGEHYISTGSLYLCSTIFLPLGLPAAHPFWSGPDQNWTAKKLWSGAAVPIDQALK